MPFSKSVGVPIQSVYFWSNGTRRVPAEYCPRIEEATGGAVRCEDLRPDVRWDVLRGGATAPAATAQAATKTEAHGVVNG